MDQTDRVVEMMARRIEPTTGYQGQVVLVQVVLVRIVLVAMTDRVRIVPVPAGLVETVPVQIDRAHLAPALIALVWIVRVETTVPVLTAVLVVLVVVDS